VTEATTSPRSEPAQADASETQWGPLLPPKAVARAAEQYPERPAIISPNGDRTFGELFARVNQVSRALRARGVETGDSIALVCSNRPEFVEVYLAAAQTGVRLTPINWHLGADEIAYVVGDCEAKVFVADERFAKTCAEAAQRCANARVRLAIGGPIEGFEPYEDAIDGESREPIDEPHAGSTMLYTSGTTGRPKGVFRRRTVTRRSEVAQAMDHRPDTDRHLCTGPLYHAAPLAFSLALPLAWGIGVVVMDGWDAEETLRLIDEHKVTHTHMVATMFHRLLSLAPDVRNRYDISSLRRIVHGAAPCPVPVKQALMDWLGPIVFEYYAATEGSGSTIGPEEWLKKPGSVGKPEEDHVQIHDDEGDLQPAGEVGTIFLRAPEEPETRFEYYKDIEKTSRAYSGEYFTLGDMGYLDEDGYLFLTDRSADLIISGGVNIYPAEVDAVMLTHPAVADSCTIGIPNDEWGEEVKGVVQLKDGVDATSDLEQELIAYCRERLARYKCPRTIAFEDELPRHDTGKLYRRLVRERYREQARAT
jgi:long-chain acyl-CoA synthetase